MPAIVVARAHDLLAAERHGVSIAIGALAAGDYRTLLAALADLQARLSLERGPWAVVTGAGDARARALANGKAVLLAAPIAAAQGEPSLVPVLHHLGVRCLLLAPNAAPDVLAAAARQRMLLWLNAADARLLAPVEALDRVVLQVAGRGSEAALCAVAAAGGCVYVAADHPRDARFALELGAELGPACIAVGPGRLDAARISTALARAGAPAESIAALLGGQLLARLERLFEE